MTEPVPINRIENHESCRVFPRDINGNHYLVVVTKGGEDSHVKVRVDVYCDTYTGKNHGITDYVHDLKRDGYDLLVEKYITHESDMSASSLISKAVNDAVCQVEQKQDEQDRLEEHVEAALEANEEIHEGEL